MRGGRDCGGDAGEGASKRNIQARSQLSNKRWRFARPPAAAATPRISVQGYGDVEEDIKPSPEELLLLRAATRHLTPAREAADKKGKGIEASSTMAKQKTAIPHGKRAKTSTRARKKVTCTLRN
jgi:hypothetical protein